MSGEEWVGGDGGWWRVGGSVGTYTAASGLVW